MNKYLDWKRLLFASIPRWILGYVFLIVQQVMPGYLVSAWMLYSSFIFIFYVGMLLEPIFQILGLWQSNTNGILSAPIGPNSTGILIICLGCVLILYFIYPIFGKILNKIRR